MSAPNYVERAGEDFASQSCHTESNRRDRSYRTARWYVHIVSGPPTPSCLAPSDSCSGYCGPLLSLSCCSRLKGCHLMLRPTAQRSRPVPEGSCHPSFPFVYAQCPSVFPGAGPCSSVRRHRTRHSLTYSDQHGGGVFLGLVGVKAQGWTVNFRCTHSQVIGVSYQSLSPF